MSLEQLKLPQGMSEAIGEAANLLREFEAPVRVFSHYDADGICAAGVMSNALVRENIPFQTRIVKGLEPEVLSGLDVTESDIAVFMDFGSGSIDDVERLPSRVVILDHHVPRRDAERSIQINPYQHGFNGSYEMSGSSLALALALALNEKNWDLSPIALAGCIGDKQHMVGLEGPNSTMMEAAVEKGHVEVRRGLVLFGESASKAIATSCDPFLAGLSGNEEAAKEFLLDADIDPLKGIEELSEEENRRLASLLSLRLLSNMIEEENVEQLVMDRYWSPGWELYLRELSGYTNACGRMGEHGTGVALCLGDGKALEKAKATRKVYKGKLLEGLLKLHGDGAYTKEHIQFFYNDRPEFSGSFAGIGMQYFLDQDKPTFSLAVSGAHTKISARGTRRLLSRGLDLAVVCNVAASHVGGNGGGHPIASGATIPKGKEEEFIALADSIVGNQKGGGEAAKNK